MRAILTWDSKTGTGAFQKYTDITPIRGNGEALIYSELITIKPELSFEFNDLSFIMESGLFLKDSIMLTDDEAQEVRSAIDKVEVPLSWYRDRALTMLVQQLHLNMASKTNKADLVETLSWDRQEKEATEWSKDNSFKTPLIDALLVSRNKGETKEELVTKILDKSNAYYVDLGALLGEYNSKKAFIESCTVPSDMFNSI